MDRAKFDVLSLSIVMLCVFTLITGMLQLGAQIKISKSSAQVEDLRLPIMFVKSNR
jgi:hypothetical protein